MFKRRVKFWSFLLLVMLVGSGWMLLLRQNSPVSEVSGTRFIRLHILANSDSEEDQQIKLKVRDVIVAYLTPRLEKAASADEARLVIVNQQSEILSLVRETLKQNGVNYSGEMQIGWFDFPLRSYGTLVLPAGKYEAVRILLGDAKGKNWWCVLFPPLCIVDVTGAVVIPNSTQNDEKAQKVEIRWKLAELLTDKQEQNHGQ